MPILNYTTTIDVKKTMMEIQYILAKAGARSISIDYNDKGQAEALTFSIRVQDNWINFRLPSNHQGVQRTLSADPKVASKHKTEDQARRVAWRITKDWVAAQMAIIESKQAELAEVFLPYAINPRTGRTLYQEFQAGGGLLGDGKDTDN